MKSTTMMRFLTESSANDLSSVYTWKDVKTMSNTHTHKMPDGSVIVHKHSHTQTAEVKKRINNIIGHLEGINNMVMEGRDCSDVLVQLSAVSSSVRKLKSLILKDHIAHCVVDAVKAGDSETLTKLNSSLDKFMD